MGSFVDVGAADLKPGQMKQVDVNGIEVAIANVGGTCYAFGNICPHGSGPLAEGELEGTIVTCPWHQSRFDVTTGEVVDGYADEPVPTFPVRIEDDRILVETP
jgi:nitrite reductase/ring-hydroxylating ferredoxin subunit